MFPATVYHGQRNRLEIGNWPPGETRHTRRGVISHSIGRECHRISNRTVLVTGVSLSTAKMIGEQMQSVKGKEKRRETFFFFGFFLHCCSPCPKIEEPDGQHTLIGASNSSKIG